LREAFGPVIDRLAANGIDLTKMPVEVAPIAHYHMGGIAADAQMQTDLPGLFAAGEAVGGANGANRLSGNAITEALVFGRRAGRSAADYVRRVPTTPPKRLRSSLQMRQRITSIPPRCYKRFRKLCKTTSARCGARRRSPLPLAQSVT
jgi:succinate dehydrogenase / fumarate reductase flavoprotein subunit/fumarate reductase (CoM/CoB) subunit A